MNEWCLFLGLSKALETKELVFIDSATDGKRKKEKKNT
jgi:hypothetical protein